MSETRTRRLQFARKFLCFLIGHRTHLFPGKFGRLLGLIPVQFLNCPRCGCQLPENPPPPESRDQ